MNDAIGYREGCDEDISSAVLIQFGNKFKIHVKNQQGVILWLDCPVLNKSSLHLS